MISQVPEIANERGGTGCLAVRICQEAFGITRASPPPETTQFAPGTVDSEEKVTWKRERSGGSIDPTKPTK